MSTHVITKSESSAGLLGNSELITGDHLDLDTKELSVVDSLLGIVTRRVEDGEKTDELEASTLGTLLLRVADNLLESDSESSETSSGKLFNVLLELVLHLRGLVPGADVDDDTGHSLGDSLDGAGRLLDVGRLGSLVNGVEGLEVDELDTGSGVLGTTGAVDNATVDSVHVLGSGSVGSTVTRRDTVSFE